MPYSVVNVFDLVCLYFYWPGWGKGMGTTGKCEAVFSCALSWNLLLIYSCFRSNFFAISILRAVHSVFGLSDSFRCYLLFLRQTVLPRLVSNSWVPVIPPRQPLK